MNTQTKKRLSKLEGSTDRKIKLGKWDISQLSDPLELAVWKAKRKVYQEIYEREDGTGGTDAIVLHFNESILRDLEAEGVELPHSDDIENDKWMTAIYEAAVGKVIEIEPDVGLQVCFVGVMEGWF